MIGALSTQATDLLWHFDHLPNESHGSVLHRGLLNGLEFVFKEYGVSGAKVEHAAGLSSQEEQWSWVMEQPSHIEKLYGAEAAQSQMAAISRSLAGKMSSEIDWSTGKPVPRVADKPGAAALITRALEAVPLLGAAAPDLENSLQEILEKLLK